jgi:hypothetical protein
MPFLPLVNANPTRLTLPRLEEEDIRPSFSQHPFPKRDDSHLGECSQ